MKTYLWDMNNFLNIIEGYPININNKKILGISIDTRTLNKGDAFFAINGKKHHGSEFIYEANNKGAVCSIIDRKIFLSINIKNISIILVENVFLSMKKLAIAARRRSYAKIIAITGSVGKTSTKEMMLHSFSYIKKIHANKLSFNNYLGVILTLISMPYDCEIGIFEVGMDHENEIRIISKILNPNIVIITYITEAHIENFFCLSDIACAKSEIFEGLSDKGTILLNADDKFFDFLKKKAISIGHSNILSFGKNNNADYRIVKFFLYENQSTFQILLKNNNKINVKINAPGFHMINNAIIVLSLAHIINLNLNNVIYDIKNFKPLIGRGKIHKFIISKKFMFTLIDESYNANPHSMRSALLVLKNIKSNGRKIAILGDMLSMGRLSQKRHEELIIPIIDAKIDILLLFGYNMKYLYNVIYDKIESYYTTNINKILSFILEKIKNNDIIMIKSSNAIGLYNVVKKIFDLYEMK